MHVNGGTIVIILVLGVSAAAAIYFTVRTYMWSRQDHTDGPEERKANAARTKGKKRDDGAPPPPA